MCVAACNTVRASNKEYNRDGSIRCGCPSTWNIEGKFVSYWINKIVEHFGSNEQYWHKMTMPNVKAKETAQLILI